MLEVQQTWIPPLDFGTLSTDAFSPDRSFVFHYMKMMYHSTLTLAMVDISVRKENELLIMCGVLVIAAIINAVVFGQFAVLTEELKANTNAFMEKLSQINAVLNQ